MHNFIFTLYHIILAAFKCRLKTLFDYAFNSDSVLSSWPSDQALMNLLIVLYKSYCIVLYYMHKILL